MATHPIKIVAIVGAAGQVGSYIVESLIQAGQHTIVAITRKDSKSKFPAGVESRQVNYEDPSTIVTALRGVDALIITTAINVPKNTSEKLIRAAGEAKVQWILPNEWGFPFEKGTAGQDVYLGPAKKSDRDLIESVGASWIGIGCGFWYQFSLGAGTYFYGFDFKNQSLLIFDDGSQKLNTTTWQQIARTVTKVLSLPSAESDSSGVTLENYRNRFVRVSSFTVNQKDLFESVKRVTGTADKDWKISHRSSKDSYQEGVAELQSGDQNCFNKLLYTRMWFPNDDAGYYEATHGLDNAALKLPVEDIDAFTEEAIKIGRSDYFEKQYGSSS